MEDKPISEMSEEERRLYDRGFWHGVFTGFFIMGMILIVVISWME